MKDQLISFEIAKLVKEVGFNERAPFYDERDRNIGFIIYNMSGDPPNKELNGYQYSAPTQSLLHRWLREQHNILITVYSSAVGYTWDRMDADGGTHRASAGYSGSNEGGQWDTYEAAFEAGLTEALSVLIKMKNNDNIT